jgi:hypothetical protein
LETAGYHTFLDIIDLEKNDFLQVPGLTEAEADRLLGIIDELTVVEGETAVEESSDDLHGVGDVEAEAGEVTDLEEGEEESEGGEEDEDGDVSESEGEDEDEDEVEEDDESVEVLSEVPVEEGEDLASEPEEDGDEPTS